MDSKEIGVLVYQRRIGMEMSRERLMRKSGVHKNTIHRLETEGSVRVTNLISVLEALGLELTIKDKETGKEWHGW